MCGYAELQYIYIAACVIVEIEWFITLYMNIHPAKKLHVSCVIINIRIHLVTRPVDCGGLVDYLMIDDIHSLCNNISVDLV